jgi:hypothetical protein
MVLMDRVGYSLQLTRLARSAAWFIHAGAVTAIHGRRWGIKTGVGVETESRRTFLKEQKMPSLGKPMPCLFVDKSSQRWVVRDPDGDFWILPSRKDAWDHREPFDPTADDSDLAPVPGHYKYMLDIPF